MSKVYVDAVALLARREHGSDELVTKLVNKGHSETDILAVLAECQRLGLQSDLRFVSSIHRVRIRQGYGPERIRRELQQKKVDRELIQQVMSTEQPDWVSCGLQVLQKKYKSLILGSYAEQQKQKQFLLYRGFTGETIAQVFGRIMEGCDEFSSYE